MKTLALIFALLTMLLPVANARAHHGPPVPAGWVLTFDDEFREHSLDTRKWTASRGPMDNRSNPVQYFLPDDVVLGGGGLTIRSERRSVGGRAYTSGDISTLNKFAQRYGRFVIRCRLPRLAGAWSAFYLLPASGAWPPEIDVTEFIGRLPGTIFLTNHWGTYAHQQQQNFNYVNGSIDWTQWHVYDVDWEPGVIRWSIDGVVRGTEWIGVSDVPMYLRLNTAIGGDFAQTPAPTGWPQAFQVDYVRVYHRRGSPPPILGVTDKAPVGILQTSVPTPTVSVAPPPPTFAAPSAPPPVAAPWTAGDGVLLVALMLLWAVTAGAESKRPRMIAALALLVAMTSGWYLVWRVQMIAWDDWWVALPLFAAEVFGIVQVLGFQYTIWPRPELLLTATGETRERPIFILIPTVNEGRGVVEPTVRGALAARDRYLSAFPEGEVQIAICNDGRVADDPDWEEMETLAAELGVLCLTRTVGGGAKAGNLETARQTLGATGEALVVIFDADMVAEPDFLMQTVPPFRDPSLGWVQTGQYYRNLENPVARWAHDQQMVFFETMCPGKARLNACFICGTNVVIRADALDEIGGLPQDSVTEDFAASVLLHGRWRSLYLPQVLATGLGPPDLPAYFTQQRRWATGTLGVLGRQWRRILLPSRDGLRPPQRVQYALSGTHYLSGLGALIFFLTPLLYLFTGTAALRPFGLPDFFRHFVPFWLTSQLAYWYACGRRLRWRGAVLGFASAPILIASLLSVVLGRRGRFVVTAKRRRTIRSWNCVLPHACGFMAGLLGLGVALYAGTRAGLVWISALWVAYALVMLAGVFRLALADQAAGADVPVPALEPYALTEYVERRRRQKSGDHSAG